MAKRKKKKLNLVQINEDDFYQGLTEIAANLNRIADLQGEELETWKQVEGIVETMTGQPRRDTVYRKEEDYAEVPFFYGLVKMRLPRTILTSKYRDRNRTPVSLPGFAISWFNKWARENPVRLRVWEKTKSPPLKILVGHDPLNHREYALLSLWAFYFRGEGWKRLKRCSQCKKWFADDTTNLKKERCSKTCSDKWWSRAQRKQAKPKFQHCPKCKRKFFLTPRLRGIARKRKQCPHCRFRIEPQKIGPAKSGAVGVKNREAHPEKLAGGGPSGPRPPG